MPRNEFAIDMQLLLGLTVWKAEHALLQSECSWASGCLGEEVIGQTPASESHKHQDHETMSCCFLSLQGSSKLEKAEILQMTVDHLKMLHATGGTGKNHSRKSMGEVKGKTWEENPPSASAACSILLLTPTPPKQLLPGRVS